MTHAKRPYPWGSYLTMTIFGITSLTSWNTVVTAYQFFHSKFNETGSRTVEVNFQSYFQIGGISSDLVVSLACLMWLKPAMLKRAITTSNLTCLVFFIGFTVFTKIATSSWSWGYLALSNAAFCLVCGASTCYIAGIMATAAMTGSHAVQGFLLGQASSGAVAATLSIITLSLPVPDPVAAGFWYFLTATVFLALALALYLVYIKKHDPVSSGQEKVDDDKEGAKTPLLETKPSEVILPTPSQHDVSTWSVFKKTWQYSAVNFVTLVVTLACFPAPLSALTSTLPNQDSPWVRTYFKAVVVFFLFNFGEVVGCFTATFWHYPKNTNILAVSCTRFIFIPLIFMCNLQPRTIPVWFSNDIFPTIFSFLLGWSEGQLLSMAAIYAPQAVGSPQEKSLCGNFQAVSCAVGLLVGSVLVFPFLALLRV